YESLCCDVCSDREDAVAVSPEGLNLGKKISVPRDVMMEELNLNTNRGSIMFQERQRRVITEIKRVFFLKMTNNKYMQGGKENLLYPVAGKHSLVTTLKNTVAKKGSPNILVPGYSGPLREIPREKFNTTVIPKSYCSPWREALGENEELLPSLNTQIAEPPQKLPPANYRCFNR
uniref:Myozenin 3a n=1 Tax=Sinocyclocheilus rhinocerous TaxID=307959 RepID=A0A673JJG1_9TELE